MKADVGRSEESARNVGQTQLSAADSKDVGSERTRRTEREDEAEVTEAAPQER